MDPSSHSHVILSGVLEIRATPEALLGEPLATGLRGAGGAAAVWRARLKDDAGRVWASEAGSPDELGLRWRPAKSSSGDTAAVASLRPLRIEVRAELADGRSAARTVVRNLLGSGAQVRSWRSLTPLAATLYLPGARPPHAVLIADMQGDCDAGVCAASAALLASHGALVLAVGEGACDDRAAELARLTGLVRELPAAEGAPDPEITTGLPAPPFLPAGSHVDHAWPALLQRLVPH